MENDTMQIGITEKEQTGSIAYILDSEDQFDEIGFRVMQNQTEILLKSHKLKYNGKIKFVYFTDGLYSVEEVLRGADSARINSVMESLKVALFEIEASGFLNLSCVDFRPSRIFISQENHIYLVYIPVNSSEKKSAKDMIEIVSNQIGGEKQESKKPEALDFVEKTKGWKMEFLSNHQLVPVKGQMVVGKSKEKANIVIDWNSAVSRVHCVFLVDVNNNCFVKDCGSSNGTFVNGMRLQPEQWVKLQEGMQVKIANENLIVRR